jgi:hypothetical protein
MIKSVCLLTTYRCNARCGFCECRPESNEVMSLEDMTRYIDEARALGTVGQIVFSGGEPTLLGDDLFTAIAYAKKHGMLTRVVTNGWWGKTPEQADAFLDRLIQVGLHEINISLDDLHQEWIPFESVKNSFLACVKRKFRCLLAHKVLKGAAITKSYLEESFGVELIDFTHGKEYTPEEECRLIATGVVVPVGPKPDEYVSADLTYGQFRGGCASVLKDIIIGANHQFLPCCGIVTKNLPELTFGDLRHKRMIDAIDEANRDLIANWLALEGPSGIAEFVKQKDPSVPFDKRYTGICHLCNEVLTREDVRRVISEHLDEIEERVILHRSFLEVARPDEELAKVYSSPRA